MKGILRLRVPVVLLVALLALPAFGAVKLHCSPKRDSKGNPINTGRLVICWSSGTDDRLIVPYWLLETKPAYAAWVVPPNEFRFLAPKRWTRLTLTAFGDEENKTVQSCAEVRYYRNRKVEFRTPCAAVQPGDR